MAKHTHIHGSNPTALTDALAQKQKDFPDAIIVDGFDPEGLGGLFMALLVRQAVDAGRDVFSSGAAAIDHPLVTNIALISVKELALEIKVKSLTDEIERLKAENEALERILGNWKTDFHNLAERFKRAREALLIA